MIAPQLLMALAYLALAVCAIGTILRVLKYTRAPMHLRWELYPVPHEKGKSQYGGSYFEEVEWWTRPRETSLTAEIRAMLEEMLLIRSLWRHNRPQWYASLPFHAGIYLLFGFTLLLGVAAAAEAVGIADNTPWFQWLQAITALVGAVGLASGTLGACALLWRRLTDARLRSSSAPIDYVNLLVVLSVFMSAGLAAITVDPTFSQLRAFLRGAMTLSPPPQLPAAIAAQIVLASAFLIYLPFSHMTHFVAKYFTYHQVRWDDAPNVNDPKMIARIQANLSRPVGWSAPHIQSSKSWAEVAREVK